MDKATKFIPAWVKVAVALALGMGTMVGWKRIVVTVGEKIGKEHLTYAQGACAELVAMVTIFAADNFGLPVTTHVLSSGVAGTMAPIQRPAVVHPAQYRGSLGVYAAGRGAALGDAFLASGKFSHCTRLLFLRGILRAFGGGRTPFSCVFNRLAPPR